MAQLYTQRQIVPDAWDMSGAPATTVICLAVDATINYSDGSADTLPANTPAVLPDTTTSFDRTHDVYVPYTVQGSGVLSIIKESLLPTLTSDYAPLARVELHGIKPYQPEPYLAAGGFGAGGAPTTVTVPSTVGLGKAHDVGAGGSPPSGWETTGFNDSAWTAPVAETLATLSSPLGGTAWVTWANGSQAASDVWLLRHAFGLPAGTVSSASLQIRADDFTEEIYVNGTLVDGTEVQGTAFHTYTLTPGDLVAGGGIASNVLAVHVKNGLASSNNPTSLDYLLTITVAASVGGASEGSLLYYHSGAWANLPIGTSGQELTVVSGDPAWATPAASGTVTSVALAGPTGTTVSGSPITSSGTISLSWASQTANTVLAAPDGSSGVPTFRGLAAGDIPGLAASKITTGQLATARGGTGLDGSAASNGAVLIGNGAGYTLATLTAGSGVSISNSSGGISISATGSGGSVTSVALALPGIFSVSGSPVTTSGTLAVSLATQSAHTVFAGPAGGSAAAPTFRTLQSADLPATAGSGGNIHAHGHFH